MRAAAGALLLLLLAGAGPLAGQAAVVEVVFPDADRTVVVRATHTEDGSLAFPRAPLERLTGEDLGDADYLTVGDLKEALGSGVEVRYNPRTARLRIRDPHALLAATRARREEIRNAGRARGEATALAGAGRSPVWGTIAADDRGEGSLTLGTRLGPLNASAGWSTLSRAATWGASLRLLGRTWISYRDGTSEDPRASVRSALGPAFLSARVPLEDPAKVTARGALTLGRWSLFATDDGDAAVGFRDGDWTVTAGYSGRSNRWLTRLSFGRTFPTLSLPRLNR